MATITEEPLFSPVSLWWSFPAFSVWEFWTSGAEALSLSSFGGQPRRFGCSVYWGFFLFSLGLFRSLRLLFRFLRFYRGRLFPAGSHCPFLGFLFSHNFSEVIDGNLRVLCLLFRLFSGLRGSRRFLRLGQSFLAWPGIRSGNFLLSPPRYKNTARSLVWAVLCVRLAVHY